MRFVAGGAAAAAVAGGVVLGICLGFYFHQPITDELGGNQLCGEGEKAWGSGGGPFGIAASTQAETVNVPCIAS